VHPGAGVGGDAGPRGAAAVIDERLAQRARVLTSERVAHVMVTVVRAQRPTSVRAGDRAIVLPDGTIDGFVGGTCAEASVRLHALRVMETGEGLMLRIVPGDADAPALEGAVTEANPCLSGGSLELFLEPSIPAARLLVVGDTPIARELVSLGERLGYAVVAGDDDATPAPDDAALVVASHGRDEERALEAGLREGVAYIGLVASRVRGAAVIAALDVAQPLRARVHSPAGLDIGAHTPAEIALSILAEIVATRRDAPSRPAVEAPTQAIDPVCGMTVAATDATLHVDGAGGRVFFCGSGCRDTFAADPAHHVAGR